MDAEQKAAAERAPALAAEEARAQWAMIATLLRLGVLAAAAMPPSAGGLAANGAATANGAAAATPAGEPAEPAKAAGQGTEGVEGVEGEEGEEDEDEDEEAPPVPPPPPALVEAALAHPLEQLPADMEAWWALCAAHASHAAALAAEARAGAPAGGEAGGGARSFRLRPAPPPPPLLDSWLEALTLVDEEQGE
jgi:hypothetical protein